jgi:acyl-CoA thioester hydrolase
MIGSTPWPDLAGRLIDDGGTRRHVLPIRVYFEDTDFSGLVYHASYVRWCERGRSDFLRLAGNDHRALIDGSSGREPAAFVVRRMRLEYLKPARIDEVLEVTTQLKKMGAASLILDQRIRRGDHLLFEAEVMVVLVSVSGKPLRIAREDGCPAASTCIDHPRVAQCRHSQDGYLRNSHPVADRCAATIKRISTPRKLTGRWHPWHSTYYGRFFRHPRKTRIWLGWKPPTGGAGRSAPVARSAARKTTMSWLKIRRCRGAMP